MTQTSIPPQQSMESGPRRFERPSLQSLIARFPATYFILIFTILIYISQEVSLLLRNEDMVLYYGAKINEAIYAGELWRFITPIFIHAGIWHIFINMYSLNAIGPAVEGFFGGPRMFVVYIFSGITGVIFSLAFSPYPSVGASGAIFGILGSLGTFLYLHKDALGDAGKSYLRRIAMLALLNLALGLAPSIDNWGHFGGLLAGAALAWFLGPRFELNWVSPEEPTRLIEGRPWREIWTRIFPAATALAILAYLALISPFSR